MFSTADTIVAIATPPGRGGIGVVRLSGPEAHAIARALITHAAALEPRRATLTRVVRLKPDPTKATSCGAAGPRVSGPTDTNETAASTNAGTGDSRVSVGA